MDQRNAEAAPAVSGTAPDPDRMPLMPALQDALPYPVESLGTLLGAAAVAIADTVQVPTAIAAQSVLAAAALVTQGFADVLLPFGQTRPLSLFMVTLAETGDRKSGTDGYACAAITHFEEEALKRHEELLETWACDYANWKVERDSIKSNKSIDFIARGNALRALGPAPKKPVDPVLTPNDLTVEGLVNAWSMLPPSIGLFTTEGGQFTGGHSMKGDSKVITAAGLCLFWDGKTYKRIRAKDGLQVLRDRRLSMHLMVQPDLSAAFINDEVLIKQGLMSRLLIAAPRSIIGLRRHKEPQKNSALAISAYRERLSVILKASPALGRSASPEMARRTLRMTEEARLSWVQFQDWAEELSAPGKELFAIKDIAAKCSEQAARIAGILAITEDHETTQVDDRQMLFSINLMVWYINEALRLRDTYPVDPALRQAQSLLDWIVSRPNRQASFVQILQSGPGRTRTKKEADLALARLVEHRLVTEISKRPRMFRALSAS